MSTLRLFDRFLFEPVHSKWLSVFRILLAGMLAYTLAPRGLEPISALRQLPEMSAIVFSDLYYVLLYLLILVFALGIRPGLVVPLLFLVALPHVFVSSGCRSKQVILCVLFCFSFLKSKPIWKTQSSDSSGHVHNPIWPIRLIQIQLSLLYGINAIAKSSYHYLSGEALQNMSIYLDNFKVDLSEGYFPLGPIEIPLYVVAIGSVVVEYFLAIGFWFNSLKWWAVVVGILFHIYLTSVVSIFMLDYTSIFLYLVFIIPFCQKGDSTYIFKALS